MKTENKRQKSKILAFSPMLGQKKGELTTTQLVTIIILIVSFVIILFLIFRLNLGETTDQEICRNSVVLKQSKLPSGPLDCKTNYLCISGGGDCEGISASEEVKVDIDNKNETMKALAEEMSSCWHVFGEGKIDYYGTAGKAGRVACSVCSIVEFDSNIQQNEKISYQEFYEYLRTTPKTSSQTYLQYLYLTNDLSFFSQEFNPGDYINNEIEFNKTYFILTGRVVEGFWSYAFSKRIFPDSASQPVIILEKTNENYEKVGCDEFLTKA